MVQILEMGADIMLAGSTYVLWDHLAGGRQDCSNIKEWLSPLHNYVIYEGLEEAFLV